MPEADDFLEMIRRSRNGYRAFAASVDLIGMKTLMVSRPHEARARINDLHGAFGGALDFYPGGELYRVCFAGDSVIVIRELAPEDQESALWASFCGHIYALSAFVDEMDRGIGNPGLRVIIAAGPLFQITQPESWKTAPWRNQTANWFALTGATVALAKVLEAERSGQAGGFPGRYCWHEHPGKPGGFLGTRLRSISLEYARLPELYPEFYRNLIESADRCSLLHGWEAPRPGDAPAQ